MFFALSEACSARLPSSTCKALFTTHQLRNACSYLTTARPIA